MEDEKQHMIKLVKVKQEFYDLCNKYSVADELLFNEKGRPCVLLIRLRYKGNLGTFVVPLRSNISPSVPKKDYFPLPPNKKTKPKYRHGVHYIKLFPVSKKYIDTYPVGGDAYYSAVLNILTKNERRIVMACQDYLRQCENGNKHMMTPDIDGILAVLDMY